MPNQDAGRNEQADLMADMESASLRQQIADLLQEIAALKAESDLDACHIAGLSAQIKALIGESEACAQVAAHPLVQKDTYTDSRSGRPISKTRALPLYRAAFDAEARARGILDPEPFRS